MISVRHCERIIIDDQMAGTDPALVEALQAELRLKLDAMMSKIITGELKDAFASGISGKFPDMPMSPELRCYCSRSALIHRFDCYAGWTCS